MKDWHNWAIFACKLSNKASEEFVAHRVQLQLPDVADPVHGGEVIGGEHLQVGWQP